MLDHTTIQASGSWVEKTTQTIENVRGIIEERSREYRYDFYLERASSRRTSQTGPPLGEYKLWNVDDAGAADRLNTC